MTVLHTHIGLAAYPSTSIYFLCSQYCEVSLLQYNLSGLVGFMVVEMAANWGKITFLGHPCLYQWKAVYYRHLNAYGKNTAAVLFLFIGWNGILTVSGNLFIVSIVDAG